MVNNFVGIGEIRLTRGSLPELKVVALGSCVAVIFFARKINTIAVAHVALPDSTGFNATNGKSYGYYADIAISKMVSIFKELGAQNKRDITIKLVGGASLMDPNGTFDIGKRNILAIRKHLWKYNLGALSEDVGDDYSRSITVKTDSGEVLISSPSIGSWTL